MKHILLRPDSDHFGELCERLCRHPAVMILHDSDTQLRFELDPDMSESQAERLADMLVEGKVFSAFMADLKNRDLTQPLEVEIQEGRGGADDITGAVEAAAMLKASFPVYEDIHTYIDEA